MAKSEMLFYAFLVYTVSSIVVMIPYSIITSIIRDNVKNNKIDSDKVFKTGFSLAVFIPVLNTWVCVRFILGLFKSRFNITKMKEKALERLIKGGFLEDFKQK